jgi:hypothetical protein
VRSSIDLSSCRRGDIANTNGQLTCNSNSYGRGQYNGQNGRGYGNGGNGGYGNGNGGNAGYGNGGNRGNRGNGGYGNGGYGNLPAGSYQQSCTNETMNGGVLTANCPAGNGARTTSSINASACRGADIANRNGRLQCG